MRHSELPINDHVDIPEHVANESLTLGFWPDTGIPFHEQKEDHETPHHNLHNSRRAVGDPDARLGV